MKKKLLVALCLFMSSCIPLALTKQVSPGTATQNYIDQIRATHSAETLSGLDFSDNCPRTCWLGIQPGVTTVYEAITLLEENNQIGKQFFYDQGAEVREVPIQEDYRMSEKVLYLADNSIGVKWFKGENKSFSVGVWLIIENSIVKSIQIIQPDVQIGYIIDLLGKPDGIVIGVHESEVYSFIYYTIYYTEKKLAVNVMHGSPNSPASNEFVESIFLGEDETPENIQHWLGYGRLNEYLPGYKSPPEITTPQPPL
jgi:hypothetical protein